MTDEMKVEKAVEVYVTLCNALERIGWSYDKNDSNLSISFEVTGEDLPMQFLIIVDVKRQLVRFFSTLPFKMKEDKLIDGAVAVCAANCGLVDGCFIYDIGDGTIAFKQTATFLGRAIDEALLQYVIHCACSTVDKYNDKFMALNKGFISIADFLKE